MLIVSVVQVLYISYAYDIILLHLSRPKLAFMECEREGALHQHDLCQAQQLGRTDSLNTQHPKIGLK
jgi:hypothetical protein